MEFSKAFSCCDLKNNSIVDWDKWLFTSSLSIKFDFESERRKSGRRTSLTLRSFAFSSQIEIIWQKSFARIENSYSNSQRERSKQARNAFTSVGERSRKRVLRDSSLWCYLIWKSCRDQIKFPNVPYKELCCYTPEFIRRILFVWLREKEIVVDTNVFAENLCFWFIICLCSTICSALDSSLSAMAATSSYKSRKFEIKLLWDPSAPRKWFACSL